MSPTASECSAQLTSVNRQEINEVIARAFMLERGHSQSQLPDLSQELGDMSTSQLFRSMHKRGHCDFESPKEQPRGVLYSSQKHMKTQSQPNILRLIRPQNQ